MNHLAPEILESIAEGLAPSADQSSHLRSCPECARKVEGFRKYFTALKSLPTLKAPSGFSARLRQRLEAESAVPGWKRFLSTLFTVRRIPLQLAGAGFAALLLFWALPRYQNFVPQSETEVGKAKPAPAPSTSETATIGEKPSDDEEAAEADEKISHPEPPRPPLPKDLAAKKSVGGLGAKVGAGAGRVERKGDLDKEAPTWSKTEDLAMIEVAEAANPEPVKTESPAAPPASQPAAKEKEARMPLRRKAASNQSADGAFSMKSEETRSAPRASAPTPSVADEPQAATVPAPVPTTDSLLRSFGFHRENRNGLSVQVLRLAGAEADSVRLRLKELGMEKLLILHALSNDSLEIEIR